MVQQNEPEKGMEWSGDAIIAPGTSFFVASTHMIAGDERMGRFWEDRWIDDNSVCQSPPSYTLASLRGDKRRLRSGMGYLAITRIVTSMTYLDSGERWSNLSSQTRPISSSGVGAPMVSTPQNPAT
jgi:hypothetical protein